jgi:hypothetical protein
MSELQNEYPDLENSDETLEGSEEGEFNSKINKNFMLDKADRSLSELHRWYGNGRLIIDPEWQRNYVWDKARASKLIESFLLDIPVPVVYLAKTVDNKYEVIDGLQRLTSIFNYFENKYELEKLDVFSELNKKLFKDLPENLQHKLQDSILRSFELSSGSGDMHFIVFERLNTGGIKLNDMEIRNCLYRGTLNELIKELSTNSSFIKVVNQKGLSKRMQDRALVLRFLAFYERTHLRSQDGLKRFLNEFFKTYQDASNDKIEEYRKVFDKCIKASLTVFGENAFRLKNETAKSSAKSSGEWASRPNAAIFQVISTSFANYDLGQVTRAADSIYEEYIDLINNDDQWVDRVRRATAGSDRLSYVFNTWQNRLKNLMDEYQPNDSKRTFSKQLKKELFENNPTCKLCKQKISLLDDAVMDHDERYWVGGKTIPENAQLTHRLCNLKKG